MYGNRGLAQGYATIIGVVLVVVGLLGFINNPIVGAPGAAGGSSPLFVTGLMHNLVHLLTGAIALFIAFGLKGRDQANGVIGLGILYLIILVALIVSPNLFGILDIGAPAGTHYNVNGADHILHAALAIASLAVGYMARNEATGTVTTR